MQQKTRRPRLTAAEAVLLVLTAAVFVAACFLLPRGGSTVRQAESVFSLPGPTPAEAPPDDAVYITLTTRIDINHASEAELTALPGVGPVTAAAIVAYREAHGPFASVEELALVEGIGAGTLSAILAAADPAA
jgi:competence protein ComEA